MWFLLLQIGSQLPIFPIVGCNHNYWQAQELQLPNRFLSCRLKNAWVSCRMHDNDSITGLLTMNVIPFTSNWVTTSNFPTLGCNCKYWQAQELQLRNGFLSCRLRNAWVSCQIHDNDSLTGLLTMNVIPLASNWVTTSNLPNLGLQLQILTSTGATAAQQVSVLQTEKCLSVLSNTWQWFSNRTFDSECDSFCFKLGHNFQFSQLWAAITIIDKHRRYSCPTGFCPADWEMPGFLVECMTMIL